MIRVALRVLSGVNAGKEFVIPDSQFMIGRGTECQLRPKSDAISRHHCAILISETQVAIRDFGSKNGTYLNDKRVESYAPMSPGDKLRVGPLEFAVVFQAPASKTARARPQNAKEVAARTAESGNENELDVEDWLTEEDPDATIAEPETRQFRLDETDRVAIHAQETQIEAAAEDSETIAETPDEKKKKREPGKLPKGPRVTTDNSRDAADSALRRFFNRS